MASNIIYNLISNIARYGIILSVLLLSLQTQASSLDLPASDFVGSAACQQCHQNQYQQWQLSDHAKAMQQATETSVLGNFDDTRLTFHGVDSHLYRDNGRFFIDTQGADGKQQTFEIQYTFGVYPLQQYLIEMENGHIQALNIAWDSREKTAGGQRWYHLRADENITPEHPFFWTRHFQNWNNRCADCHSTNVERNYDVKGNSYATRFSEISVACEACHGAGKQHLDLVSGDQANDLPQLKANHYGFSSTPKPALSWKFEPAEAIARPHGQKNSDDINMCGNCHALRTQLVAKAQGAAFHDSSMLQMASEGPYFADGQAQQETFVMGSFLQSKMYQQGVTCVNCHNPHTGKVLAEGNGLCSQCHQPEVFDTASHHHHAKDSSGAACVNCHMPERTYMQVDDRRDHSFSIPRPDLSITLDVPNACTGCHTEPANDAAWAAQQLKSWGINQDRPHWATLNRRLLLSDPLATRGVTNLVNAEQLPALIRASLLAQLAPFPSRVSIASAQQNMNSDEPLVRRAAAAALRNASLQTRWQVLEPYLNDDSRSVRFQIADTLADLLNQLPKGQETDLSNLLDEYRQSLLVSQDSPAGQLALADLANRMGNTHAAKQHYLQALRIEPNYVPALINLADYYRQSGQQAESQQLLDKALNIAPDSGATHYAYGLMLIRQQQYQSALDHLKSAVAQNDASPSFAYAYALALEHQDQLQTAITVLADANNKWPNQYDLLMALVIYSEKAGDKAAIYGYLSSLSALAPGSPQVQTLINKYR